MKYFIVFFTIFCTFNLILADDLKDYRDRIIFTAFSESFPNGTVTQINDTLETFNCDFKGNTTFVVHGWLESIDRPWARPMINEFSKLRGNCVFFMDYSSYSSGAYAALVPHFYQIANLLTEKILKIAQPENLVMFGFSFGARLVTQTGAQIGSNGSSKVDKIYACDPAGPGFDPMYRLNPQTAANFVQCIHTSITYGTRIYNCHQDWRMGVCGNRQIGARPFPYGSHGLCPYFFLSSFTESFAQKNIHRCKSLRRANNLPDDLIMGPRESRILYFGDIFAPTARNPPWSGYNESDLYTKQIDEDLFDEYDANGEEYYNELLEI